MFAGFHNAALKYRVICKTFRFESRSNESTKHNIKEFLLLSCIIEMTDNYESLRMSKFNVCPCSTMKQIMKEE